MSMYCFHILLISMYLLTYCWIFMYHFHLNDKQHTVDFSCTVFNTVDCPCTVFIVNDKQHTVDFPCTVFTYCWFSLYRFHLNDKQNTVDFPCTVLTWVTHNILLIFHLNSNRAANQQASNKTLAPDHLPHGPFIPYSPIYTFEVWCVWTKILQKPKKS